MSLRKSLAQERDSIPYRPRLNKITGSVLGSILFQQILYWSEKNNDEPFYKFFAPCSHDDYREGDSWEEELGFSRREMESALKSIAVKITKGVSKTEAFEKSLIIYWTDKTRKTWYQINPELVDVALESAFLCNVQNEHYITKAQNEHQRVMPELSNTYYAETNAETTTERLRSTEREDQTSQAPPKKNSRTKQQDLTDAFYEGVRGRYGTRLTTQQYAFHLGHFSTILKKDEPTDDELTRVVAHMVDSLPKAPKIDAEKALQDVRMGRDTGEAWEGPAPWEAAQAKRKEPTGNELLRKQRERDERRKRSQEELNPVMEI